MQKEINFYREMASEHRLQEYSKGTVTLTVCYKEHTFFNISQKTPSLRPYVCTRIYENNSGHILHQHSGVVNPAMQLRVTVGENIIATTKIPNNCSAIQSFNIGLFSIAPCKVITLDPLCILFGISSLLLF